MKFSPIEIKEKLNDFAQLIEENETVETKKMVELFEIADFLFVEFNEDLKKIEDDFTDEEAGTEKKIRRYRVYFKPSPEEELTSVIANVSTKAEAHSAVLKEYPRASVGLTELASVRTHEKNA